MKNPPEPTIIVGRAANYFEYYIRDDGQVQHFRLTPELHEKLKRAQFLADAVVIPQKDAVDRTQIPLKLAEND